MSIARLTAIPSGGSGDSPHEPCRRGIGRRLWKFVAWSSGGRSSGCCRMAVWVARPMSAREDAIERATALLGAATPGPWRWSGNTDGAIELVARHSGGTRLVTTLAGRPCIVTLADGDAGLTQDACGECARRYNSSNWDEAFDGYRCHRDENLATIWLLDQAAGSIRPANYWATPEVSYRTDVASVDHPDAQFIAAAPDLVRDLLALTADHGAEVERLRALVRNAYNTPARQRKDSGQFFAWVRRTVVVVPDELVDTLAAALAVLGETES